MDVRSEVTGETLLHDGRFIQLKMLDWTDGYGKARKWESAERPNVSGAVLIIARLKPSDRVVLIRQYRPPARRMVYEFPAGLMDAGETPERSALRELREETGYIGTNARVYPFAYTTPGLSSESVYMVCVDVDETQAENIDPKTEFDPSEMIESFLIGRSDLAAFYKRETAAGASFDAKLAAYVIALGADDA